MSGPRKPEEIYFVRNETGQTVYDIYFTSMSATEVARRHRMKREDVLKLRHSKTGQKLIKLARAERKKRRRRAD